MPAEHDRRIDYLEFTVPDVGAARRFYEGVFGWAFTDYGPHYTSFTDGRIAGGFEAGEVRAGSVLVVLYAADLAVIEAAVVAAGGVIVKPVFAFPGGRRFHFRDPNGVELAVWSE